MSGTESAVEWGYLPTATYLASSPALREKEEYVNIVIVMNRLGKHVHTIERFNRWDPFRDRLCSLLDRFRPPSFPIEVWIAHTIADGVTEEVINAQDDEAYPKDTRPFQ
jgi:hypothetical protein